MGRRSEAISIWPYLWFGAKAIQSSLTKESAELNTDQFSPSLCPLTAVGETNNMSRDYNSGFDPVGYLEWRWDPSKADKDVRCIRYKIATFMARFYQDFHHQWDPRGAHVLELGGGPAIGNLCSAGPYVSKITSTDYLSANLEQITLWKKKSPAAFNWDATFQHVVKETRGAEADVVAVAAEWQEQLREKISIDHCDFRREGFIDAGLIPDGGFDVLMTTGAFEYVAKDKGEFTAMLKTCHSLLKQGGYIATATYGKHSSYKVSPSAEKTFCALYLTAENVQEALSEAGFIPVRFELITVDFIETHIYAPIECYCFVAKKA